MKLTFNLADEKTLTNDTVKITALIMGAINKLDRIALEQKAKELSKKLFDKDWAFSNFNYSNDGFSFSVQATVRVDAAENDRLAMRAAEISTKGDLTIDVIDADVNIPLHRRREAESDLRVSLIDKANAEASKLGGTVDEITFSDARSQALSNAYSVAASYMETAGGARGAKGPAGPSGESLGHSEKLTMGCVVKVTTGEKRQLNG